MVGNKLPECVGEERAIALEPRTRVVVDDRPSAGVGGIVGAKISRRNIFELVALPFPLLEVKALGSWSNVTQGL